MVRAIRNRRASKYDSCFPIPMGDAITLSTESEVTDNNPIAVPEKRGKKARYASIVLCLVTTVFILATLVAFPKIEGHLHPGIFTTGLTWFGVLVGTIINCFTLVAEEWRHTDKRYNGSMIAMVKACMSGICFEAVTMMSMLVLLLAYACFVKGFQFTWQHGAVLVSGIGFGPLALELLSLDKTSKVEMSNMAESNELSPGITLAWHYYFNCLQTLLPTISEEITSNKRWSSAIVLPRLHILMPLDWYSENPLTITDSRFIKEESLVVKNKPYSVDVYRVENIHFLALPADPLKFLLRMCTLSDALSVTKETKGHEVKFFYRTLKQILFDPPDGANLADTYELVLYNSGQEGLDELREGIMTGRMKGLPSNEPSIDDDQHTTCNVANLPKIENLSKSEVRENTAGPAPSNSAESQALKFPIIKGYEQFQRKFIDLRDISQSKPTMLPQAYTNHNTAPLDLNFPLAHVRNRRALSSTTDRDYEQRQPSTSSSTLYNAK